MRLIDADALKSHVGSFAGMFTDELGFVVSLNAVLLACDCAPTIDAENVRYGRWTWITEDVYRCENCGERVRVKEVMGKPDWDYCPNCGAKMDGEKE